MFCSEMFKLASKARRKGTSETDAQAAELKQKSASLRRDIEAWIVVRTLYVPAAEACAREADTRRAKKIDPGLLARSWDVKLWLPSDLSAARRASGCVPGAVLTELRLRIAHCETCLAKLRQARRYRAAQVAKFFGHVAGTGEAAVTRARGLLLGIENTITRHATLYSTSWGAIQRLAPLHPSSRHLLELRPEHNSGPVPEIDELRLERDGRRLNKVAAALTGNTAVNAQLNALAGLMPGRRHSRHAGHPPRRVGLTRLGSTHLRLAVTRGVPPTHPFRIFVRPVSAASSPSAHYRDRRLFVTGGRGCDT
jgi:hypothetical protein